MSRRTFLYPLIVPAVIMVWSTVSEANRETHVVIDRAAGEIIFSWLIYALLIGGPAFWSGWLYRQNNFRRPAATPHLEPRASAPAPPPPPPPPPPPAPSTPF